MTGREIFCSLLVGLGSSAALASVPALSVNTTAYHTSDGLDDRAYKLNYRVEQSGKRVENFGVQVERHEGRGSWLQYRGLKTYAFASFAAYHNFQADLAGGFHRLSNVYPPDPIFYEETTPHWSMNLFWQAWPKLSFQFRNSKDFIYQDWIDLSVTANFIRALAWYAKAETYPFPRWRAKLEAQVSRFSDDNQMRSGETWVQYQWIAGDASLWAGVGASLYSFREHRENYWSPAFTESWGLRAEAYVPLAAKLSANLNLNAGPGQERYQRAGLDSYLNVALGYRLAGGRLGLFFVRLQSRRPDSDWRRQDLGLDFSVSL